MSFISGKRQADWPLPQRLWKRSFYNRFAPCWYYFPTGGKRSWSGPGKDAMLAPEQPGSPAAGATAQSRGQRPSRLQVSERSGPNVCVLHFLYPTVWRTVKHVNGWCMWAPRVGLLKQVSKRFTMDIRELAQEENTFLQCSNICLRCHECSKALGWQHSGKGIFFQLKKFWTELVHFSQLQSWPLQDWREGDVSPLPFYTSGWKWCARRGQRAAANSGYAPSREEDGKGEDVSALDCHLFQH